MFKNLVVVLLLAVILIAPASSWADHGIQVLGEAGVDVIIWVQTGPDAENDWEFEEGVTDASGCFLSGLDSDPTALFYRAGCDEERYDGPDPNPNNFIPASWTWYLLDDQGGWR